MNLPNQTPTESGFRIPILSGVMLNLLMPFDQAHLIEYAVKAVIGGAVWLGFQLIANWIDRKQKQKDKEGKEDEK